MLTVNLEEMLIKKNKKVFSPEALLIIKEYDTFAHLAEDDSLSRIGLNKNLSTGKSLKWREEELRKQTANFSKERVFHVSQIESLCKKYRLRFLPPSFYVGTIDKDLPNRISNFEIAYGVVCNKDNTMIAAPIESFKLQEKPKDPLFFYKINSEYYYLIHKWGNDISITRRLMSIFESKIYSNAVLFVLLFVVGLYFLNLMISNQGQEISANNFLPRFLVSIIVSFLTLAFFNFFHLIIKDRFFSFFNKNEWTSQYIG